MPFAARLPSKGELLSYDRERLLANIAQHNLNIQTFQAKIAEERQRIEWLHKIIEAKKSVEEEFRHKSEQLQKQLDDLRNMKGG